MTRNKSAPVLALLSMGASLLTGAGAAGQIAAPCVTVASFNERCEAWAVMYDDGTGTLDGAEAVATSPDGSRVFVTGFNYVSGQAHPMFDSTTIAYEAATGAMAWQHRWDQVPDTWDWMHDIAVSPDGARVYVTGLGGLDFRGGGDAVLLAYGAQTGTLEWVGRYDAGSIDEGLALATAPDGDRIYMAGVSLGDGTDRDIVTVGFDAATGESLWASRYDGPAHGVDQPVGIAVGPEGDRVITTGWSLGQAGDDYVTIAYEAGDPEHLGQQLWLERYDGHGRLDRPAGLSLDPSGDRVFVAGRSETATAGTFEAATVAYDAGSGEQAWEARFGPDRGAEATAVAAGPAGDLVYVGGFVAGEVAGQPDRDFVTLAYAASTGTQAWMARPSLSAGGYDTLAGLLVGPGGEEVFVTGKTSVVTPDRRAGVLTIAYAGDDGTQRWVARYGNGTLLQYDHVASTALDPTGRRLFITGGSAHGPTEQGLEQHDYLTVAYDVSAP